jgi:hypothetical protein
MLQLNHMDVAKVDWRMLHMLHMLQLFSGAYCNTMFRVFQMFQRYVSSVFSGRMLQLCLSGCYICFTHMLHVFDLELRMVVMVFKCVSSVFSKCFRSMFQVFHMPSDVYFNCSISMFQK